MKYLKLLMLTFSFLEICCTPCKNESTEGELELPITINDGNCHFTISLDSLVMMHGIYDSNPPYEAYIFYTLVESDTVKISIYPRYKHGVIFKNEDGSTSTMDKLILSDPARFCENATNYPVLESTYVSDDTTSVNETFESACCRHCSGYVGNIATSYAICDSSISRIVISNCPSMEYARNVFMSYCLMDFKPIQPYRPM